jgi:hypothetical protein
MEELAHVGGMPAVAVLPLRRRERVARIHLPDGAHDIGTEDIGAGDIGRGDAIECGQPRVDRAYICGQG